MLRLLDQRQLDGYVFQSPGAPPCELLSGNIMYIYEFEDSMVVYLRGSMFENGAWVSRTAKVLFRDRGADRKLLATRFKASKAEVGSYMSVLIMIQNKERIVLDFKFHGLWRLSGYLGEKNVILGKAFDYSERQGVGSVKFLDYNNRGPGQKLYKRFIRFKESTLQYASVFQTRDKPFAVCICGPESKNSSYSTYDCEWFEILPT